jgi:hypothetical protein
MLAYALDGGAIPISEMRILLELRGLLHLTKPPNSNCTLIAPIYIVNVHNSQVYHTFHSSQSGGDMYSHPTRDVNLYRKNHKDNNHP